VTSALAYFRQGIKGKEEEKKFYNIDTWALITLINEEYLFLQRQGPTQ
jgi:hypothetical protein